jgi:hypothetical protein
MSLFVFQIEKDWKLPLVRKSIQQQFNSLDLMKTLFTYLLSPQFELSQFYMVLFVIEGLLRGGLFLLSSFVIQTLIQMILTEMDSFLDQNAVSQFRSGDRMSQLQQFLQRNSTLNTKWTKELIDRIQSI